MSTYAIIASGSDGRFSVARNIGLVKARTDAIEKASGIVSVIDRETQAQAIAAASELKGHLQSIESDRITVKAPYWETGKLIDKIAGQLSEPLEAEVQRIEKLVGAFQAAERRKAQEEMARQERVRIDAERAARAAQEELERARKAQEDTAQAEIDAAMAAEEADEVASTVYVEPEVVKAQGAAVRPKITYEVTDIEALYQWDKQRREDAAANGRTLPSFIKLEVKKGDFGQFINILDDQGRAEIPGVQFSEETKVAVRATAPKLTIQ